MSFYLKFFGAVLIAFSGTFCGFLLSEKLKLRCSFLQSFSEFLCTLETNIRYNADEIITLINKCATNRMLDMFSVEDQSDYKTFWQSCVRSIPNSYGLKQEDYNLLFDFGRLLGSTDTEGQLNHIQLYKSLFQSQCKNAEEQYKSKARLYKILGFFAGAVIAVMFL